jgi:hypothetical protein
MDFSGGGQYANKINAVRERVNNQYGWSGGSCVQLDKLIKDVRDKIVSEKTKPSSYNYGLPKGLEPSDKMFIDELINKKANLEMIFASNSCSDKIETLRQNESAVLITKQAIEQEKSVLKPSNTDQRIYIGVGALVLLVGLIILVRK